LDTPVYVCLYHDVLCIGECNTKQSDIMGFYGLHFLSSSPLFVLAVGSTQPHMQRLLSRIKLPES